VTGNSITFSFYDAHRQGFPGDVLNIATYTLTDDASWISRLISIPFNKATPIMLANHVYWNLGAFMTEEAKLIYDNTLYMPYADRYIQTDGILVPNGTIGITNGTALDFVKPSTLGPRIKATNGTNLCGTGCVGIDNAFVLDRPRYTSPEDPNLEVLTLSSPVTGIQLSLETNMQGTQIYTCNGQNGTIPVKKDQQHLSSTTYVEQHGCIVIEAQDVSLLSKLIVLADRLLIQLTVDRRYQQPTVGTFTMADLLTHHRACTELPKVYLLGCVMRYSAKSLNQRVRRWTRCNR
jgi:aldose 1-epimerase